LGPGAGGCDQGAAFLEGGGRGAGGGRRVGPPLPQGGFRRGSKKNPGGVFLSRLGSSMRGFFGGAWGFFPVFGGPAGAGWGGGGRKQGRESSSAWGLWGPWGWGLKKKKGDGSDGEKGGGPSGGFLGGPRREKGGAVSSGGGGQTRRRGPKEPQSTGGSGKQKGARAKRPRTNGNFRRNSPKRSGLATNAITLSKTRQLGKRQPPPRGGGGPVGRKGQGAFRGTDNIFMGRARAPGATDPSKKKHHDTTRTSLFFKSGKFFPDFLFSVLFL